MDKSAPSWQRYILRIAIPLLLGWAVARTDFRSSWQNLGFVLAVGVILLSMNFPWANLRGESQGSKSARNSLIGLGFVLVILTVIGYEVIVMGRENWFVDHALILLVALSGLILLLKAWISLKGSRNEPRKDA